MIVSDRLRYPVKVFSSVLISGALGLELWNILAESSPVLPWPLVFYLGRFALVSHGIEAMIAAVYASSQGRSPLFTGIYTFFVGTIGLFELFQSSQKQETNI